MAAIAPLDDLVAVYKKMADALDPLINDAVINKNMTTASQLERAQRDLRFAALDIDAQEVIDALQQSQPAMTQLTQLTQSMQSQIVTWANQEKSVARFVGLAAAAIEFATALKSGNIGGILKALRDASNAAK